MKDIINNYTRQVTNFIKHLVGYKPTPPFRLIKNYFHDYTKEQLNKEYLFRQAWGLYHPSNLMQWYDKNAVSVSPSGVELSITDNAYKATSGTFIPNGIGLLCSIKDYSYGLYEWDITLPEGSNLWPAIWLTNSDTWPPEIDVLEGYSNSKGKWGMRLNTNLHLGDTDDNHYQTKAMSHGWLVDKLTSINLKLIWTTTSIEIYYNDFLVRKITNFEHLGWFNRNPKMKVIMNNAIIKTSNYKEMSIAPLIIHTFTYKAL